MGKTHDVFLGKTHKYKIKESNGKTQKRAGKNKKYYFGILF